MRVILTVACAATLSACSPSAPAPTQAPTSAVSTATSSSAQADSPDEFQSPSGNIGCQYVPAGGTETYTTPDGGPQLICDRVAPAYVRFTLSAHGAAALHDHVGD